MCVNRHTEMSRNPASGRHHLPPLLPADLLLQLLCLGQLFTALLGAVKTAFPKVVKGLQGAECDLTSQLILAALQRGWAGLAIYREPPPPAPKAQMPGEEALSPSP